MGCGVVFPGAVPVEAMIDQALKERASDLLEALAQRGLMLVTAESCTGGLIAATLTEVAGSSRVVERGFVTYSNASKSELLGVPAELIAQAGAVSEAVAREMAIGALKATSRAHLSVSVTGIAGPGGGSPEKPVGLVHVAVGVVLGQGVDVATHTAFQFGELGRSEIRRATVDGALRMLGEVVETRF